MPIKFELSLVSWTDYAETLANSDPVVMVPIGAIEQHGPHLPLATDSLIPEAICKELIHGAPTLLAPTIAYGYKSIPRCGGGQHFPGTTSLDAGTLIDQIRNILREFARHGIRKIALVVGHMENQWFVTEACDLALRELKALGIPTPRIMQVCYWEFLSHDTVLRAFDGKVPDWTLEHAGIMETSVMLYKYPELVKMERLVNQQPAKFPTYDLWPYDPQTVPASGILNSAIGATAAKGKLLFDEYVSTLSKAMEEAFS